MAAVKEGDTVRVQYTGRLEDGTIFDTSKDSTPLEFKVGDGKLLKAFEQGVIGMDVGESKTIKIPADEAYGLRREEMVFEFEQLGSCVWLQFV